MAENPVVYVVDDDEGIRKSIESLLRSVGLNVQTFASAQEFLAAKRKPVPGCLVLDVRLPGLSGLDLQSELARAEIQTPIVFITGHGDIPMTVRAMKAGAVEFLTKPFRDQDLLDAIRQAIQRDQELQQERAETTDFQKRVRSLTPREREVMKLVVSGLLNKQIAAELGTSEVTVKLQRRQVMRKMMANSLAELVRIVEKSGEPEAPGKGE
ncbi:MAG TPA: response regulator transcription factor [Bryobacteraceae bacterium]|jgi:FixJ family two-component response regulator